MSIDELTKATTIDFKVPLNRKESEEYLRYLADNLPADITTNFNYFYNTFFGEESILRENLGALILHGNIRHKKFPMAFDTFSSKVYTENFSKIEAIEFWRVQDWDLSDYREEVKELWSQVKKVTNEYFAEKGFL